MARKPEDIPPEWWPTDWLDKPWALKAMNRLDLLFVEAYRREARRARPLVSGNKVKERKAQADAALYRTMAAKIVEKWPNLKDNIAGQARAVANELGLPKEKLRSIRRMLSQK